MNSFQPPIVVVAYNRPRSLTRLLTSLSNASYISNDIDLIISIDKAENNQNVLAIAEGFIWKFGTKKVICQEKNLGLRAHILKCGSISLEYGSVIVLEDDLFVSPNFYNYTIDALNFTKDKKDIGGISLYNHQTNVCTLDNFQPVDNGYDNWYFQFASSWGQAWSKEHWKGFIEWYQKAPILENNLKIPRFVRSWSSKSWLKYNIAYVIEKNLYFLYPRVSLTSNFSDIGTHVGNASTAYQVPLQLSTTINYNFGKINKVSGVYDAFFENTKLAEYLALEKENLIVDLYGHKENYETDYLLTNKVLDYKIIKSFGRLLKPIEANIIFNIVGNDFYLYNLNKKEINSNKPNSLQATYYNIKYISLKESWEIFRHLTIAKVKRVFKKLFK